MSPNEDWRHEMTGRFTYTYINTVEPGGPVKVNIGFWALNPGALYWKTFLIATIAVPELRQELDAARELGQEAKRNKSYWLDDPFLGPPLRFLMPDNQVAILLQLFGHDDANKQWNWTEYDAWAYYGQVPPDFPQPLCYAVIYLNPREMGEPSAPAIPDHQVVYTDGTGPSPVIVPIPPPPEPGKFPWGVVAIVGGGAILLGSLIKRK